MSTETLPELDADLVERTAKAIGLARINTDYPGDPQISADGYALYWQQTNGEERTRLRQQAVAALRGSELLKRVDDLERAIERVLTDLDAYGHDDIGNANARLDAKKHLREVHDKQIV